MTDGVVVFRSAEWLGPVRRAPWGDPVDSEFVAEVLRVDNALVDTTTQAVYSGDGTRLSCLDLSWLTPRDARLEEAPEPNAYLPSGVLVPLANAHNPFYLILETCAAMYVADLAGVLAGSNALGWNTDDDANMVDEALAAYGCRLQWGAPVAGEFVRVGTLHVPRFWLRDGGSVAGHLDSPRWAAAGYSSAFFDDLRSRLLPVDPETLVDSRRCVAYDPRLEQAVRTDLNPLSAVDVCRADEAVIVPPLGDLGLAGRASFYSGVDALVALHGDECVNSLFLPPGAAFDELFVDEPGPGQFTIVADVARVAYTPVVVPSGPGQSDVSPGERSAEIPRATLDGLVVRHRDSENAAQAPATYVLTTVWDDAETLDDWLRYHRSLGLAGVLAVDVGSVDGSLDILSSAEWSEFVEVLPSSDLPSDDDRVLVDAARQRWPSAWGILLDPDEFLVTGTGDAADPMLLGAMRAACVVTIPRYPVTARRSAASPDGDIAPTTLDLDVRLARGGSPSVAIDLHAADPPADIPRGMEPRARIDLAFSEVGILRVPVLTLGLLRQKVARAAEVLAANPGMPQAAGRLARWAELRDRDLVAAYLDQFVRDDLVAPDGTPDSDLVVDRRLVISLQQQVAT